MLYIYIYIYIYIYCTYIIIMLCYIVVAVYAVRRPVKSNIGQTTVLLFFRCTPRDNKTVKSIDFTQSRTQRKGISGSNPPSKYQKKKMHCGITQVVFYLRSRLLVFHYVALSDILEHDSPFSMFSL
jgi:hypothetical protein